MDITGGAQYCTGHITAAHCVRDRTTISRHQTPCLISHSHGCPPSSYYRNLHGGNTGEVPSRPSHTTGQDRMVQARRQILALAWHKWSSTHSLRRGIASLLRIRILMSSNTSSSRYLACLSIHGPSQNGIRGTGMTEGQYLVESPLRERTMDRARDCLCLCCCWPL